MADIIKKNMTEIWASAGDVQAPEDSKIRAGWVVESVPRQWWNWFENRQDNNIAYMLQKGIPEWDAETEYQTNKSYVQRNNVVYKATAVSINKDPALAANASSWVKAFVESSAYLEKIKNVTVSPATMLIINSLGNPDTVPYGTTGLSVLATTSPTAARNAIAAQVAHPNLTALSGVTAATNVLPYFNGSSTMTGTPITTFSRDFLSRGDPTSGRAALGLGTAAIYNAQPQAWSTSGLMFAGAFGLGGYAVVSGTATVNVNDPNCPTGFYDVSPDSIAGFVTPIPGTWTRIIHQSHSNAAGFATQIATGNFATAGVCRVFVRKAAGSGWGDWSEIMNTSMFPAQTSKTDGVGADPGVGKLMRVGAFGIGSLLDLRDTIWSTGTPSQMQANGTIKGLASGGQLQVPGLGVNDLGVLTVDAHWTDASGIRGYVRTFTNGDFMYIQPSGASITAPWAAWRQIYTSNNTSQLTTSITADVTANIQPTLNAKLTFEAANVTYGATDGADPDTTEQPWLLSAHPNCPEGANGYYWYITTTWYAGKGTGNRMQTAVIYNISPSQPARSYVRTRFSTGWTPWNRTDNAGNAASATRWATARNIGFYGGASGSGSWDGTGDLSIALSIVNDSHLHSISTISGLQGELNAKAYLKGQPFFEIPAGGINTAASAGQIVTTVTAASAEAGNMAGMTFLRQGYYGVNMGITNLDNHVRIGGYSMGAVSYPILHTGNAAALGFGGTSGALGASGWTRLGNGLIIQWGSFTGNGNIPFPTAFPSACTAVAQMQSGPLSGNVQRIALNGNPGNTSFNVTGVDPSFNLPARWIALGY